MAAPDPSTPGGAHHGHGWVDLGRRRSADHGPVLLLILPLWALLAGHLFLTLRLTGQSQPFRVATREMTPFLVTMFLLSPLILWSARKNAMEAGQRLRSLAAHGGILLVVTALDHLLERSLFLLLDPAFAQFPSGRGRLSFASDGLDGLLASLCLVGPFYLLVVTGFHAMDFRKANQERALAAAKLEAEHYLFRLQTLKSQLHPHFLFNALNALYGHIPAEAETAQRMLVLISDFLRRCLQDQDLQKVTLAGELEFARLYLDIQSLRFCHRLTITWEIDPTLLHLYVPHLILQPLVENAIKHGLGARVEPGRIRVRARSLAGGLELEVLDNGPGPGTSQPGSGLGLANVRMRLQQLYQDRARLETGRGPAGGFSARIRIPVSAARQERQP